MDRARTGFYRAAGFNEQQIQDLVEFLWASQISEDEVVQKWDDAFQVLRDDPANAGASDGQLLYELHCARCHTPDWSARGASEQPTGVLVEVIPGQAGAGGYGRPLNSVTLTEQFPDPADQVDFISRGAVENAGYGEKGLGNYGMPGFGDVLTDEQIGLIVDYVRGLEQQPGATAVAGPETAGEDEG